MCCLFGLYDYGGTLSAKQKNRMIAALAAASEVRGIDATGIAYCMNGHLSVYKRPLPAHWMRFRIPEQAAAVMGHTRMTTQGSEYRNYNNHPFSGKAGQPFALAHNGVLTNDGLLRRQEKLPVSKIETDSFIIVQLLEQAGSIGFQTLRDASERLAGSFTYTVLDGGGRLYIVRGNNPFCLSIGRNRGCISTPPRRRCWMRLCSRSGSCFPEVCRKFRLKKERFFGYLRMAAGQAKLFL